MASMEEAAEPLSLSKRLRLDIRQVTACLRAMTASQMEPLLQELDEQAGFARPKSKMPSADAARN